MRYILQGSRPASFATNSSSSHYVITGRRRTTGEQDAMPADPAGIENEFGWGGPAVVGFWEKVMYALVQRCMGREDGIFEDAAEAFPELASAGVLADWVKYAQKGYVDHQSIDSDIKYWAEVARDRNAAIVIDNDNH